MKTSFCIAVYVHLALANWSLNGVDVRNIVITTHLVPMSIPEASIRDVSLIHCVVSCIGNGTCLSGYYWKGAKQCQLKTAKGKRPRDAGKSNAHHFVLRETAAISDKYDYHPKEKTWEEARKACEELPGASLIQIKSQEQQDTARKLVENSTLELIHIGIFHHHGFLPPSAEWKYMDKTIITYSSWADGEPNPKMLTHAALKKDAGYKWAAVGNEERGGWICDRHPKNFKTHCQTMKEYLFNMTITILGGAFRLNIYEMGGVISLPPTFHLVQSHGHVSCEVQVLVHGYLLIAQQIKTIHLHLCEYQVEEALVGIDKLKTVSAATFSDEQHRGNIPPLCGFLFEDWFMNFPLQHT